ncbi:AP-2 complex protein, putative [Entamoeba histolytica HM-1:IMSS-B]|uniref:AP-2 complex protein, putative n=6 Tax=Entamoeba histolytica TaxID=5759 RepID=B1N3T8_ENTH1|nr:AP-2 complex protein, putative [Entamoeba histolytica HM-1:IMSS]EMD42458.1 AP2 complex subunit beta-1, putative [Entamoeba histolytica KU27]EMH72950.1 AP-2 complex protein, putative [Entamoeba histolytica HM-1:IMSS-B]EMS15318.1 AP-2 complex subunit beta-1, putative [Entamoeba histolytica HM-3:IMSS]ENY64834.1 AP-2 complex subunit beta-1, putative [Entamoeba histolytica HM-1:IMSS-A]GAT96611.1 AP 2 complex protein putative [Entamoeba histolytica]|eukprot:XP_001913856.1 AP-2 complex protein, putative [Entamoeba histolytica HM-1:IMSS]
MIKREIKNYQNKLQSAISSRNIDETKSVIQNIIIQSTRGVDMSPLFADVIMACETDDIELKKMVYMYLCTYSEKYPELSILCVNTFYKDCRDSNPIVRGLAIRCMSNFEVDTVREHLYDEIDRLMDDNNTYVRRCSLMALGKVFKDKVITTRPKTDFIPKVVRLTLDNDPSISLDALIILKEINDGKVTMTKKNIEHILGMIKRLQPIEVAEAAMLLRNCEIMEYSDVEHIMNAFDEFIDSLDPASVMETIELFLYISEKFIKQETYTNDILQRATDGYTGLYNYYSTVNAQIVSVILNGILSITQKYNQFFKNSSIIIPTYNDPEEIVMLKMKILQINTTTERLLKLMKHFKTLILDTTIQKYIVDGLVQLGYQSRENADIVISSFVELLNKPLRRCVEIKLFSGIARLIEYYNDITSDEIKYISYLFDDAESIFECDEEDITHVFYICGEYEECFNLDIFIQAIEHWKTLTLQNKQSLLTASVKGFINNKERCSTILKEITKKCLEDEEIDLKIRSRYYLNLIDTNLMKLKEIVFLHHY